MVARIIALSAILFSSTSWAGESFDIKQLQNLFKAFQRKAAYNYASTYLSQMEGNPYFDYLYGVSAIDTGHASQGVFALERVTLMVPEDHVARLELARGYFILEEYARARKEFERVMAINPPKPVKDTAQRFLDMIRIREAKYHTTSNGFLAFGMGSDSNVNSGADDDLALLIPGLTTESLGQDDTFATLVAAWQITQPFAPGWMFNSTFTANTRINSDHDEFNTLTATIQTGINRLYKDSNYKVNIILQQFNLDSTKYRTLGGMNLEWHNSLTQKSKMNLSLQYAVLDYEDSAQEFRNSSLITFNTGYTHAFTGPWAPVLFSNINIGTETVDDDTASGALENTERDIQGVNLGVLLNFSTKLGLQTSFNLQNSNYATEQLDVISSDQVVRDDNFYSANISLLWLFNKDVRLDTKVSYSKNDSNIKSFNYDKTQVNLNVHYAF